MSLGGQSRGLIQASKTAGWDPTVIPARGDKPAHSIANFDKDQGSLAGKPVGDLPGGAPDGWPDDTGISVRAPMTTTFNAPDFSRENANRRTRNANPIPGMPGAA